MNKVSIIVTTWLEKNKHYLDLVIQSIKRLDYDQSLLDITVVGKKSYKPVYQGVNTVAPDSDDFGNAEGLNFGVLHASADSDYYLLLNDDVILTKSSLLNMVEASRGNCIVNPISPCDNGLQYALHFGFWKDGNTYSVQSQFTRYDDLKEYIPELMAAQSGYPTGQIKMDHLCMFATLIPKKAWQTIGPLEEKFKTGPDDIDYSKRAKACNIPMVITLDAVVWHFGGVTSSETLTNQKRIDNALAYKAKWGELPEYVTEEELTRLRDG